MVKIKLRDYTLGLIFLCIGAAASIGYSQESANDYVSPRQAVPRGTAPAMQVQLLSAGRQAKEYAVIFGEGVEAFSGLLAFAQTYHVTSAHFTTIWRTQQSDPGVVRSSAQDVQKDSYR